jgi:fatty acid desaturase
MTSNLRGGVALLIDWLALIVLISVGISINHWLVTLILLWPIGLFQFSIGEVLAHEASHYNLFRNRRWNNWAEWLCTLPFFFSISDWGVEKAGICSRRFS